MERRDNRKRLLPSEPQQICGPPRLDVAPVAPRRASCESFDRHERDVEVARVVVVQDDCYSLSFGNSYVEYILGNARDKGHFFCGTMMNGPQALRLGASPFSHNLRSFLFVETDWMHERKRL